MTRPPRLLMTVDAVGGVWQYATELCGALAPSGVEIVLANLGPPPAESRRASLAELPHVKFVDTGIGLDWLAPDAVAVDTASTALARLATAEAVSLVHCNHPALIADAFKIPVVATIHSCVATWWEAVRGGALPDAFRWQTERVPNGLRQAAAVVAPTHAFAAAVARTYDLRSVPQVVANGRSMPPRFQAAPADVAFTAGRLWDIGKGIALLDEVAARLSKPLRAAGSTSGPNGESIAPRHIERLGALDDRVLALHLAGRPVFVSAARYEPFGLAVLEAAQAGCALVLSDIATFREIWDGAASFVRPDDATGYVGTIEALFADAGARATWGRRARERATLYTPERTARGMMAIYEQVHARESDAARPAAA